MEYFQQTSRHIAILQLLGDSMANHHWRNLNLPHDGQERDGVPMADVSSQNPCAGVLDSSQNHHKKTQTHIKASSHVAASLQSLQDINHFKGEKHLLQPGAQFIFHLGSAESGAGPTWKKSSRFV